MRFRYDVHNLLPPFLFDATRPLRQAWAIREYRRSGQGSMGYSLYKAQFIRQALANPSLLDGMRHGLPLPATYGVGIDERCVEFPWLLAQIGPEDEVILDAGSTLNHDYIVTWPGLTNKTIHIVTLSPEDECYWKRGISYLYADLRDLPLRDNRYSTVICASVLEHVGFDNTVYGAGDAYREKKPFDFKQVMAELRRVLSPGGRLLLTVPYGQHEDHGWLQQFDRELLTQALDSFGPAIAIQENFFLSGVEGWKRAVDEDCHRARYRTNGLGAECVACIKVDT